MGKKEKASKGLTLGGNSTKTIFDIGTNSVKIVQVEKKGKKITIKNAEKIEGVERFYKGVEGVNMEALLEEIEANSKMKKLKKRNIEIAYSNKKMQAKIVTVKEGKEKELQEQVKSEIEKNFGQTIEEGGYVVDYCHLGKVVNKDKNEESILIVLAEEKGIEDCVEAIEKRGAVVKEIQPNVVGLANALKVIDGDKESKMLLNMGNDNSTIIFMVDGVPVYSRAINFGGAYLLNKLQMKIDKTKEELEEMMINLGLGEVEATTNNFDDPFDYGSKETAEEETYSDDYIMAKVNANKEEEDEFVAIMKENFENFIIEIERSITFVRQNTKFESEKLIISGGLSHMEGIVNYMKNSLMMDIEVYKIKNYKDDKIEIEFEEELGPEFAILLGVAVRGMI